MNTPIYLRTVTRQVPNAARAAREADRKAQQAGRFADLDLIEDEFRKIFCFCRTAGGPVSVVDALEIISDICRHRLGLPAKAVVAEGDANV